MVFEAWFRRGDDVGLSPQSTWADSLNSFTLALAGQLADSESFIISPHNIASALVLLAAGAQGPTLEALCRTLNITATQEDVIRFGVVLRSIVSPGRNRSVVVGASVWHAEHVALTPAYLDLATTQLAARVTAINFGLPEEAAGTVNAWVAELTQNNISEVITPDAITPDLLMVLCTAMYFRGVWKTKFDPARTTADTFHGGSGDIPVQMMNGVIDTMACETPLFQAVNLPYEGDGFDLVIVLPQPSVPLERVRRALFEPLAFDREMAAAEPGEVTLALPRYELQTQEEMIPHLASLGLGALSGPAADFGGMSEVPLWVSQIRHFSRIRVDEEGTVAAAATVATMDLGAGRESRPMRMKVDRPFFFLLRERSSGAILFYGQVVGEPPVFF